MNDRYLKHFQLIQHPFAIKPNVDFFYPGGQRALLLKAIIEDLQEQKSCIQLTGEPGVGKTLLVWSLIDQLSASHEVVYIDNPVGSFEHILCTIRQTLDLPSQSTLSCEQMIEQIINTFQEIKRDHSGVLVIIDEAENLLSATLERLLHFAGETNTNRPFQFLLVGQYGLDDKIRQLGEVEERLIRHHYTLPRLTLEETTEYIDFRLTAAMLSEKLQHEIFNKPVIQQIFQQAGGNLKKVHQLAEKTLRDACIEQDQTEQFFTASPTVTAQTASQEQHTFSSPPDASPRFLSRKQRQLALATGGLLLLFLCLSLFKQPGTRQEAEMAPLYQDEILQPAVLIEPSFSLGEESLPRHDNDLQYEATVAAPEYLDKISQPLPLSSNEKNNTLAKKQAIVNDLPTPQPPLQVSTFTAPQQPSTFNPPKKQPAQTPPNTKKAQEIYFLEQVRSGRTWWANTPKTGYTLQLMALASSNAAANLTKLLSQQAYFSVRQQLHLLIKPGASSAIFVFYGHYLSREEALTEWKKLTFLKKERPYPISLIEVRKKLR